MKILYSCLSKSWGGMEMRTIQGVKQLLNRNISTELICNPNSKIHLEAKELGFTVHLFKSAGYFNPLGIIKLYKLIKKNSFDLIHTQASKDLWLIVPALQLANSKLPLLLTKRVGSFIKKKDVLHKWLYNRVNYAIAISRVIKQNLLDTCPLPEEKIILLHNGIDIHKYDPQKYERHVVRKEYNIRNDELVLGMLARFSPGKGHEEFLFATKKLIEKYENLKFMIVGEPSRGEDDYAEKIKILADEYRLKNKLIFTGFRSDIPEVLAAMDIFVFPSHSEAFGLALVEAMAMGKPSVCSNSDGVLDIAVDGVTSYLFTKQDGGDLAQKLQPLINSPQLRKQFGDAARKRVLDNFDIEILTDRLISLYQQVVLAK